MNDIINLIRKRRTIRLFSQEPIELSFIETALDCARLAPSAANLQFIEYLVVLEEGLKDKLFENLRWGGYVYPKRVPPHDRKPQVYIIILLNKNKSSTCDLRDVGAAVENAILSFLSMGIGSCWLANINRDNIREIFKIPSYYDIDSVLACGYPQEEPICEENATEVKYWIDSQNVLHVPKRPLSSIVHYNYIQEICRK